MANESDVIELDTDDLRAAAKRLPIDGFFMSIPARPDYDADLLLAQAAEEIDRLRSELRASRARVAELEKFKAAFPPVDDGEIARRMVSDRAVAEWKMWMRNEVLAARRYSKATIIRSVLHVCEPDAAMAEAPPTQAQRDGASEGD